MHRAHPCLRTDTDTFLSNRWTLPRDGKRKSEVKGSRKTTRESGQARVTGSSYGPRRVSRTLPSVKRLEFISPHELGFQVLLMAISCSVTSRLHCRRSPAALK